MKKFFTEILKLVLFIGLLLGAAYLTGNWENLIKIAMMAKNNVEEVYTSVVASVSSMLK